MTLLDVRPEERLDIPVPVQPPTRQEPSTDVPSWRRTVAGLSSGVAAGLFWGWNAVFLAFVLLGFVPMVLPNLLTSTWQGTTPPIFFVYAAVLVLIPLLAVAVGWIKLRHDPNRLFALGYGVEGPAMMLTAISLFGMREMNPAVALMFGAAALGQGTLLWTLLAPRVGWVC